MTLKFSVVGEGGGMASNKLCAFSVSVRVFLFFFYLKHQVIREDGSNYSFAKVYKNLRGLPLQIDFHLWVQIFE